MRIRKILYWICASFQFVHALANAQSETYQRTAAAKLFNEPSYWEMCDAPSERRLRVDAQKAEKTALLHRMLASSTDWEVGIIEKEESPYNPLDLMLKEIAQARTFLTELTNSLPLNLEPYLDADANTNCAVALWSAALQSYQDGKVRVVIPDDIRMMTFLTPVVQSVNCTSKDVLKRYQWVDDRMMAIATKMYLEASRNWIGEFSTLWNNEQNFNRQGHGYFWETLFHYLGIISHHDREYAYEYFMGLLACQYTSLTRPLWDAAYYESIQANYERVPNIHWAAPADMLMPFAKAVFPEKIQEIEDWIGAYLLTEGDRIFLGPIAGDIEPQVIGSYRNDLCKQLRKIKPQNSQEDSDMGELHAMEYDGSPTDAPLLEADDFRDAAVKYEYYIQQYLVLTKMGPGTQEGSGAKHNSWVNLLNRKMGEWECGNIRLPSEDNIEEIGEDESPQVSELNNMLMADESLTHMKTSLASAYCTKAYAEHSVEDIKASIAVYRNMLKGTEISDQHRVECLIGLARACICKGYLAEGEREQMNKAADAILHSMTNDEKLDSTLRSIAGQFSMKWFEAQQQGRPQDVIDWFGWMEELRAWEKRRED